MTYINQWADIYNNFGMDFSEIYKPLLRFLTTDLRPGHQKIGKYLLKTGLRTLLMKFLVNAFFIPC